MKHSILQNIGLSSVESQIYLSLLNNGKQNISQISEKSSCNRVQIYDCIPRLLEKGIIGQTLSGKRKVFYAESPENLESIFQEKENEFYTTIEALKGMYDSKKEAPELRTLQGIKGIQKVFNDLISCLEVGETFYRYSGRKYDTHKEILSKTYRTERDEKKLERMVITNHELAKQKNAKGKKIERQIVSIPKNYDLFEDNISKIIYKDRVAIIDYNTKSSFIIRNKKFADFEKKIFKLLFKSLKEY